MDFIKKNKKTIFSLVLILIAFLVVRVFGLNDEGVQSSETVSATNSVVSEQGSNSSRSAGTDSKQENKAEKTDKKDEGQELSDSEEEQQVEEAEAEQQVEEIETEEEAETEDEAEVVIAYTFRNNALLEEHFEKHGDEFPYSTKEEYLEGANIMLNNPNKLHKIEKDDGDDVYYLEETNEFIIVSKDGYLRTYFKPSRGKSYFDRQ